MIIVIKKVSGLSSRAVAMLPDNERERYYDKAYRDANKAKLDKKEADHVKYKMASPEP